MALFGSKNQTDTEKEATSPSESEATSTQAVPASLIDNSQHDVLVQPHITEKATYLTDDGIYTFVVKASANKPQIKQAVKDAYGVDVRQVRTVKLPKKTVTSRRGKTGTKGGMKKAYVYLNEGDSIELM
jgi:large subunit ribosomal protein L23